jgi:hypothetical protein
MVGALHQDAAPQMAMELLGRRPFEIRARRRIFISRTAST